MKGFLLSIVAITVLAVAIGRGLIAPVAHADRQHTCRMERALCEADCRLENVGCVCPMCDEEE